MPTNSFRSWDKLPIELRFKVMHCAPDAQTLRNMALADPIASVELQRSFGALLQSILGREIHYIAYSILLLHTATTQENRINHPDMEPFLQAIHTQLSMETINTASLAPWSGVTTPLAVLAYIADIQQAVQASTATYLSTAHSELGSDRELPNLPLSETEVHRIHRGLWRLQLCCELAAFTRIAGSLDPAQQDPSQSVRHHLSMLPHWEVEELQCVYTNIETRVCIPRPVQPRYLAAIHLERLIPQFGSCSWKSSDGRFQPLWFVDTDVDDALDSLGARSMNRNFLLLQQEIWDTAEDKWGTGLGAYVPNDKWSELMTPTRPVPGWRDGSPLLYARRIGYWVFDGARIDSWVPITSPLAQGEQKTQRHSWRALGLHNARFLGLKGLGAHIASIWQR